MMTFDGGSPRLTASLVGMIKLFERMFGDQFWGNVVFVVTKWSYSDSGKNKREKNGDSEGKWTADWNREFHKEFHIPVSSITLP